ncbi:MAG: DUF1552 domain-containing protein, partial [Proteobacteria bacterium]
DFNNTAFSAHWVAMNRIVVKSLECGMTNVATLMYGPGMDKYSFTEYGADDHHSHSHYGGYEGTKLPYILNMNRLYTTAFSHLLTEIKKVSGLLDETLIVMGSEVSDSNEHLTRNLPVLVAGAGSDMRFGNEIGGDRFLADLYVDLSKALGLNLSSFGSGVRKSTGKASGIYS